GARRLARALHAHGLGCRIERTALEDHESGQDHVGLCLLNSPEYLEAMLGAYRARVAPFNVNYRYVDEELLYLLQDADAAGLVYHARYAPTLGRIRDRLPRLRLLLQVDDGSGEPLLPGAPEYEAVLAAASPAGPAAHARRGAVGGVRRAPPGRHRRAAGAPGAARPGRRLGHGRARAGEPPRARRRRVRAPAPRRPRSTVVRPLGALRDRLRRSDPVAAPEAGAARVPAARDRHRRLRRLRDGRAWHAYDARRRAGDDGYGLDGGHR